MGKAKTLLVATALGASLVLPATATPAYASHNCGLEDVDRTVDTICDHYHDPKPLLGYLICLVLPTC